MKKIVKNYKGFTLVELLVVISIIAILSVVGLTLFNGAQVNARDARRKSDIDAIANALEIKRAPGQIYYKEIVAGDMSSGSIPADSVNVTTTVKYCVKLYTTDSGAQVTNPTWDAAGGPPPVVPDCPTGFSAATVAAGFAASNFPTTPAGSTIKSFKLCARLEVTGGSVYCKNSAQ